MPLRQVYPELESGQLAQKDQAKVDIIAVHGLNPKSKNATDHAWDTWRTPSGPDGNLWLRDELPKELPDTRIFLHEYDSTAVYGNDKSTFIDKANTLLEEIRVKRRKTPRRPLLLLGHSLGGLLIKQALINAHNNEKYVDTKFATQGLAFFATPHDGGRQALVQIGQIAAKIAMGLGFQKGDSILNTLENGTLFSEIMHEHWRQRLLEYPIVSFWGSLDTIVPKESTSFGLPGKHENVVCLQAKHGRVCKFGSSQQEQDNLELVQANIQDLYDEAIKNGQNTAKDQSTVKEVPKRDDATAQRQKRVTELLKKLDTSGYTLAKDRNPKRVEGTCQWFTSHHLFQRWRDSDESGLLWVSADPGCGKSVLARYLLDDVLPSSDASSTCYFFFKDDAEKERSGAVALSCILRQVFLQRPDLLSDDVLESFESRHDRLLDSLPELWSIFLSAVHENKGRPIICIFDALDECEGEGRRFLTNALSDLYRREPPTGLNFLLTSRPYMDIKRGLRGLESELPTIHLRGENEVEVNKIEKEIDLVVAERVTELGKTLELTQEEQEALLQGITRNPNRTYLWVHLIFEFFETSVDNSPSQIREKIQHIPPTVNDAYEKILSKSPDERKARKLLAIVVAALRPLSLEEMAVALAIGEGHTSYSDLELEPEKRFRQTVRDLCGLFVSILDGKIYFLHLTVREFLMGNQQEEAPSLEAKPSMPQKKDPSNWRCSLPLNLSHRILAVVCTTFLLFEDVARHLRANIDGHEPFASFATCSLGFPFLDYAMENWAVHFRLAEFDQDSDLKPLLHLCDPRNPSCLVFMRLRWEEPSLEPEQLTPLIVASFLGVWQATRSLMNESATRGNAIDGRYGRSALSWAAQQGFTEVVNTLMGLEAKSKQSFFSTAKGRDASKINWKSLAVATKRYGGKKGIFNGMFDTRSVDVNARDRAGRTALAFAAERGPIEIVHLLLSAKNLDADMKDRRGFTPLALAVYNGATDAVAAILHSGRSIDVDLKYQHDDFLFERPSLLHHAAIRSQAKIVEMLINSGANINSTDTRGRTPFMTASMSRKPTTKEVLSVFLRTGQISINLKDHGGSTALMLGAMVGNLEVVEFLLATNEIDVDPKDAQGRTLLSLSAARGHVEVVKLILAAGNAMVNSTDTSGRTPLSWSAERGYAEVVKLFLATGDVLTPDSRDLRGRTPLSWAAGGYAHGVESDDVEVVELLLGSGRVNVESRDETGRTPLSWCLSSSGNHDVRRGSIVLLLVDVAGADVNSMDDSGRTPLMWNADYGDPEVARGLLSSGRVDLDAQDHDGHDAVWWARKRQNEKLLKVLDDYRARNPT